MLIAPVINQWFTTSLLSTTVIFDTSQMPIFLCPHIPCIPKSFGSHLFCVNIRALVSASITCCQIKMTGHYSCQIRIVGMLIAPVINQWFTTSLLSTTVIFDTSQMPICLCPHIPCIPKSFGSHLFCVNIRALVSASITCCQIRMTGH